MNPTPDRTLADPQQIIDDLQRALAERTAERDEAESQKAAMAEVLEIINSSPGDLAPVFDAILEKAMRLCEAAFGNLRVYDGKDFRLGAMRGLPPRYAAYLATTSDQLGGSQRALRGENVIHVIDLMEEERYRSGRPSPRALVDLGGARSLVVVALRKDSAFLGTITIYRQEVRPFTNQQIALLENFAAQAVIAMENARLLTETREALEQQTATAEVLGVINSSPGDLAPVFDAMLDKAMRLCDAAFGIMRVSDGEQPRTVRTRGVPAAYAEFLTRNPVPADEGGISARNRDGEPFVHTVDLKDDDRYRRGVPTRRAMVDLGGARTSLSMALRRNRDVLGAIHIYRQEVRPFSDKQIALLQNFAAQAVIALENARLINETREALEQQTATAEVLGVINSSPADLTPVFDAMLEKATRLCEATYGQLYTYDGKRYHPVAVHGEAQFVEWRLQRGPIEIRQPAGTSGAPLERLVAGERVVVIDDAASTEAYRTSAGFRAQVDASGIRSRVTVALRKDAALLGAITVYRLEVRPFTDKQIALLQNFAAQAVIAMENARLITETREALEQQTATAEVLGVINSSPGDLAPVFDAILEKAHSLCGAAQGALVTYDGEHFRAVATRGLSEAFAKLLREPQAGPLPQRLLQGERFVHIDDFRSLLRPIPRAAVELEGARTVLFVPLRKDGALLGFITAYRQEVRPFSDKQITLLENFAAQAVIAMENARLITETREASEQQTATAEVLQVINSSPGNIASIFDAMLEKALRLCGAEFGVMNTFDGEHFHHAAERGVPAAYASYRRGRGPMIFGLGTAPTRLVEGENFVPTADLMTTEPYQRGDTNSRALVELGGARSLLCVALRKGDILLGDIVIYRQEVRPFTDREIALLQNFAAQAVIAIENARLITETREALEQQTATAEVLQVINSSPGDLAPVFDAILEKAHSLCGATHGNLVTYDGEHARAVATHGMAEPLAGLLRQPFRPLPNGPLARLVREQCVIHIPDLAAEAQWGPDDPKQMATAEGGVRTMLFVPLRKDDIVLGWITANRLEMRPFSEKEIALLESFAAQAVIAMENARLLGELQQRTEEVGKLNRDLEARVAAQVDELSRVGRLKRFLAPQLAELIVSHGDEKILESHRREIVVVFCDLRGYTAFTETAEPEEVLDFLRQYHGALGPLVSQFEGTLDQFSGDGIMVFFNDPVPCPDPAERAVKMAMAMREVAGTLIAAWRRRGRMLGFGAGIAQGYATLGQIGFADRSGYTAIGTVCNLAARLCAEAKDGQILIAQLVAVAVEETTPLEEVGELTLKGLTQPVVAYNVPLVPSQPALRVIEGGGPQTV